MGKIKNGLSNLARYAINLQYATPIINEIIDKLKKQVTYDTRYYYYINADAACIVNSFEEKCISAAICFKSNLGVQHASIAIILMSIIHNGTYGFFFKPSTNPRCEDWFSWMLQYVSRDNIVVEPCSAVVPPLGLRRKIYPAEIYTLDNIWEVMHSRDYK